MKVDDLINKLKTLKRILSNRYSELLDSVNHNIKIIAEISVLATIAVLMLLFYWNSLKTDTFVNNGTEKSSNQKTNLTEKNKVDILKSLSTDSVSTNISKEEKHKKLNKLSEQSKDNKKIINSEKINILKNLSE